ncbi:hypothetical protein [Colwellia sp. MB02u-6]|nr:hypothetical protein [Colwellia sp. MB02u-6]
MTTNMTTNMTHFSMQMVGKFSVHSNIHVYQVILPPAISHGSL